MARGEHSLLLQHRPCRRARCPETSSCRIHFAARRTSPARWATNTTIGAYQLALPDPLFNSSDGEPSSTPRNDYYGMTAKGRTPLQERLRPPGHLRLVEGYVQRQPAAESGRLPEAVSRTEQRRRPLHLQHQPHLCPALRARAAYRGARQPIGRISRSADGSSAASSPSSSGTPVSLPTNSAFFQGGDPGSGFVKTRQHWFDTSKFAPFPSSSTPAATLSNPSAIYPAWTGASQACQAPSYEPPTSTSSPANGVYQDFATWRTRNPVYFGDVRNPAYINQDVGLRKTFPIHEQTRLQLRFDAFNAVQPSCIRWTGNHGRKQRLRVPWQLPNYFGTEQYAAGYSI